MGGERTAILGLSPSIVQWTGHRVECRLVGQVVILVPQRGWVASFLFHFPEPNANDSLALMRRKFRRVATFRLSQHLHPNTSERREPSETRIHIQQKPQNIKNARIDHAPKCRTPNTGGILVGNPDPLLVFQMHVMPDADSAAEIKHPTLSPEARRVLGALIEKAKTTPDNYPMTLAAIVTACNQKSNRSPQMSMDETDALLALDQLRELGAAREIQGSGRTNKYRHAAYEWLDLDNPTSAVLTELLLRGPQTVGELRTRASRMYSLDDLNAAQTAIDLLIAKGLVESLTPPGRGQTFAHTLYTPDERQYLEAKVEKRASAPAAAKSTAPPDAVEKIMARLDTLESKLESIEQRLASLES